MRLRTLASHVRLTVSHPRETRLFLKYRSRLMDAQRTAVETLAVCRSVRHVEGDLVECGVWRAGMSAAMAETLRSRTSVLFDAFEGFPLARDIDGPTALASQHDESSHLYKYNVRASEAEARKAMDMSGANYRIFAGWFDETVSKYAAEEPTIAVLRLDGDWYDSITVCLEHLFPCVVSGGVVFVDDYGWFDGCTRAVHDYLSGISAVEPIRKTQSGVAYLVKQ